MPDFFAHRFAHTNFAGPIHTLVQIGAHSMQDIEDALRVDPVQIVLTTMDPDLAQKADDVLEPWRVGNKTARVEHVAITAKRTAPTTSPVWLYQQPALSSRKKPTGLRALFPDLTPHREVTVPSMAVSAFANALPDMPNTKRHMLRLGLTGDEHALVAATGGRFMQRFHDVVISLPQTALFDRGPLDTTLLKRLHDLGFIPLAQREGPLRGVPECHLIKSPHHAALQSQQAADTKRQGNEARQKARIQSLTKEKERLHRDLDQITLDMRDLKDLRDRYKTLMTDYETQSETLRQVQARVKAALARFEP